MLYISNFFEKELPMDKVVSIANSAPKGITVPKYSALVPSWSIVDKYHKDHDAAAYTAVYEQQLAKLDAVKVASELDGKILCCWEKTGFCHRFLVQKWFQKNGIDCRVWGQSNSNTVIVSQQEGEMEMATKQLRIAATGHRPSVAKKDENGKTVLDENGKVIYDYKLSGDGQPYDVKSTWSKKCIQSMINFMAGKIQEDGVGSLHIISGMAQGIDTLWAIAAINLKKAGYPVTVEAAVPCLNHASKWTPEAKKVYAAILKSCDKVSIIHMGPYEDSCMQDRNLYMVQNADLLYAVWDGSLGGTANCVHAAENAGIPVIRVEPKSI